MVVASSRKMQTKVGTLACFDFLLKNELCKNPAMLFHVDMISLLNRPNAMLKKTLL